MDGCALFSSAGERNVRVACSPREREREREVCPHMDMGDVCVGDGVMMVPLVCGVGVDGPVCLPTSCHDEGTLYSLYATNGPTPLDELSSC